MLVVTQVDLKPDGALVMLDFLAQQDLLALAVVKGCDQNLVGWGTGQNPPPELVVTMYRH